MNVFSLIARIEVLTAVVLAVIGVWAGGDARFPLLLTAGILGLMGGVFLRVGGKLGKVVGRRPKLLQTGEQGTAVIAEVSETGLTINNEPVFAFELDVDVSGRARYRVEVKQRTPRMAVGAVLPGSTLNVAVDPNDPNNVAIDWFRMPPQAAEAPATPPSVADVVQALPASPRRSMEELLSTGRRVSARLTAVQDAGDMSDLGLVPDAAPGSDDRLFLITLDILRPGMDPQSVTVGHRVPERLVGRIGPGAEVEAAQDRDDPTAVAIDWDAFDPGIG